MREREEGDGTTGGEMVTEPHSENFPSVPGGRKPPANSNSDCNLGGL